MIWDGSEESQSWSVPKTVCDIPMSYSDLLISLEACLKAKAVYNMSVALVAALANIDRFSSKDVRLDLIC